MSSVPQSYGFSSVGASDDPSRDDFHGSQPFSTVEAANYRDTLANWKNVDGLIDLHCYGQVSG